MESSSLDIEKTELNDWIESETRALDVVASWESLCDTYRILEFVDPISDTVRMEEFKWIIKEMNKHLSRARKQLMTCTDPEAARQVLLGMFSSTTTNISGRRELAYHKLRQRWVSRMLAQLETIEESMKGRTEDGRPDYWND